MKTGMRHEATGNRRQRAGKAMNRKIILCLLTTALLSIAPFVEAQKAKKVPRVGCIVVNPFQAIAVRIEAFRQGLRDLGYVEGRNIVIDGRSADGKLDRMPELAAELVRLKVDIIVTGGSQATSPAKEATNTIPIVMAQDNDPIGSGFADLFFY